MTNKKATKRALTLSIISMLICVVMLAGTTFAWFTDSVTSGVNQIIAGNLDVELTHTNKAVTTEENVTDATAPLFADVALWEPGAVAYENLTVKNVGSLALKYDLSINFANENTINGNGLSTALSVGVVEGGVSGTREQVIGAVTEWTSLNNFVQTGTILANAADDTYGVVIYWMPKANDNDWNVNNGQKTDDNDIALHIDLGVKLFATQFESEIDSFDENYDKDAYVEVTTADELKAAIAKGGMVSLTDDIAVTEVLPVSGQTVINLNGYDLDASACAKRPFELADGANLTINGSDETVVKTGNYGLVIIPDGDADVTINGGKYVAATDNGSFIKPKGTGVINITLNNVDLTDTSVRNFIIDGSAYEGDNLTIAINGGTYNVVNGVITHSGNTTVKNAVVNVTTVGFEAGTGSVLTIDNTAITVNGTSLYGAAPNTCVAASDASRSGNGGNVTINNSTLTSNYYVLAIYSDDTSAITATGCKINATGSYNATHIFEGTGTITVNS